MKRQPKLTITKRPGSAKSHDQLERSCMELVQVKYKPKHMITMIKTDAATIRTLTGRYVSRVSRGMPDCICCINGRFCWFEFKTGAARPRLCQRTMMHELAEAGAIGMVINTISQFDRALELICDVPPCPGLDTVILMALRDQLV